jgi:hypothetical protein
VIFPNNLNRKYVGVLMDYMTAGHYYDKATLRVQMQVRGENGGC